MDTEDLVEEHRCTGCQYNDTDYVPECDGCRRRLNIYFNTAGELPKYRVLEDKYVAEVKFGTHRVLVKK